MPSQDQPGLLSPFTSRNTEGLSRAAAGCCPVPHYLGLPQGTLVDFEGHTETQEIIGKAEGRVQRPSQGQRRAEVS